MVTLRRSTRAKTQSQSYYEDAKIEHEEKLKQKKREREETLRKDDASYEDDDSATSDSEDDFDPKKQKSSKSPGRPPKQKTSTKKESQRIVPVSSRINNKKTKPRTVARTVRGHRAVQTALTSLARKVLEKTETPDSSLLAALLRSSHPTNQEVSTNTPINRRQTNRFMPESIYTPQLDVIARRLVKEYSDANGLHIQLFNLLFRSIGGSVETNLEEDVDLEDMDNDEWDPVLTNVVEVMRQTEADRTLLCANPAGDAPSSKQGALGISTYRQIYLEFWYRLGRVILLGTASGNSDNDDTGKDTPQFSSFRFEVEMVRDLVTRLTELVSVGQPDMRAAATMAVLQLALSCLDRTVDLESKLEVATRQHTAASKANTNRKMQALRLSVDAWKRHKTELEELVEGTILQAVFMHRYRDSNPHIRQICLRSLSKMTLMRPDLFLQDKYLKYLGWMCSDKNEHVRLASLQGLLAPFQDVKQTDKQGSTSKLPESLKIDLTVMHNVSHKFLNRFVDCTEDLESLQVQEVAMELLLAMLKEGFLDDWEDDNGWDQVNLKALDNNSSAKVRKDALYFILDQLDCFDSIDEEMSSEVVGEKKRVERLEGIACWIANKLCDGPIPIDKIRVHLTDYVVQSLRDMPEHKTLATDWSVMLKAIRSESYQQDRRAGREEVAKQRVLLRMLACAAELEVGSVNDTENLLGDVDKVKNSRKRKSLTSNIGVLSEALLKSLPQLLLAFKGDVIALRSLAKMPRYVTPEVFSLPGHRNHFNSLVKNLCSIYAESTDETVLQHTVLSLSVLVEGDHPRVPQVKIQLKQLSMNLQDRLMELLRDSDPQIEKPKSPRRKRRSGRSSDTSLSTTSSTDKFSDSTSATVDVEHSIRMCLMRWRILVKRCQICHLFDEKEEDSDDGIEGFCSTLAEAIAKRLKDRQLVDNDDETSEAVTAATIWEREDISVHAVIAKSVYEALLVLLFITAWKLQEALPKTKTDTDNNDSSVADLTIDDDNDSVEVENLAVLHMRDRLVKLLGVCFDQFLEEKDDSSYTDEQVEFAAEVQTYAGRVASDLRVLFPREWSEAADPIRQALALTNDAQLIGGFARYLRSREHELHALAKGKDKKKEDSLVDDLLMPVAKSLTANWNDGNRREAAIVLAHITGSGRKASQTVQAMARMLKKVNSVRFLEAQMISLRLSFEHWLNTEPEDLETDRPTEEQMNEYEEAEIRHQQLFHSIEQQASRLSMTLGVSKLTDKKLSRALIGFLQEGIRYAFHGDQAGEDELVLGSRLPFLLILSKYANWLKKDKERVEIFKESLDSNEAEMRANPEYDEVHEDDLAALSSFRDALGIKHVEVATPLSQARSPSSRSSYAAVGDMSATSSPASTSLASGRHRVSTTSSQKSRRSALSSLSPLYEEDATMEENEEDDTIEDSPSPQKRRRLVSYRGGDSLGSSSLMSTLEKTQRIEEVEEEEGDGSHQSSAEATEVPSD